VCLALLGGGWWWRGERKENGGGRVGRRGKLLLVVVVRGCDTVERGQGRKNPRFPCRLRSVVGLFGRGG
jgi:hypothetical protein